MAETKTASWKNYPVVPSFCFGRLLFTHTPVGAHGSIFLSLNEFKPQPSSTPYAHAPSGSMHKKKIIVTTFPLFPTLCFSISFPAIVLWSLCSSPPNLTLTLPQTAAAVQKGSTDLMFFFSF